MFCNDTVMQKWLRLDDPVDEAGDLWGVLAVGFFADSGLPGLDQ